MRSRYDLAKDSITKSSKGTYYKDIFTIPMQKFQYNESYGEGYLIEPIRKRPDLLAYKVYKIPELDDLILWINNIGFIYDEELDVELKIPTLPNLEQFYYKYRV